jgi:hypothetical protein
MIIGKDNYRRLKPDELMRCGDLVYPMHCTFGKNNPWIGLPSKNLTSRLIGNHYVYRKANYKFTNEEEINEDAGT